MQIISINNVDYYSVKDFAELTNKSEQTIRRYIIKGNKMRKLNAIKIAETVLIPISELTEFPFTICGRSNEVYHYDNSGKIIEGALV